jgi:hypothetical protein
MGLHFGQAVRRLSDSSRATALSISGPLKTTTSHLHVHALHRDTAFSRAMTAAVEANLDALAKWLGLDHVRYE